MLQRVFKKLNPQIVITLVLILATIFSLYFMLHTQIIINSSKNDKIVDRFVQQLNFRQFDLNGKLIKSIQAQKATHIDYNNTSFFESPRVVFTDSQGVTWNIQANKGQSIHGTKQLIAIGHVILDHSTVGNHIATKIETEWMLFNVKKDFAYSHQPVTITRPDSITKGVGMTADFKNNIFKILSKADITYIPQTANISAPSS